MISCRKSYRSTKATTCTSSGALRANPAEHEHPLASPPSLTRIGRSGSDFNTKRNPNNAEVSFALLSSQPLSPDHRLHQLLRPEHSLASYRAGSTPTDTILCRRLTSTRRHVASKPRSAIHRVLPLSLSPLVFAVPDPVKGPNFLQLGGDCQTVNMCVAFWCGIPRLTPPVSPHAIQ